MSLVRSTLYALVVTGGALAGPVLAQGQAGGMSGIGPQGPGFMGSGSGSSGTVDGGMSGTRETPPGAARAGKAMRDARNHPAGSQRAVSPDSPASGPAGTGVGSVSGNGGSAGSPAPADATGRP